MSGASHEKAVRIPVQYDRVRESLVLEANRLNGLLQWRFDAIPLPDRQ
jgi:hypothetical protein